MNARANRKPKARVILNAPYAKLHITAFDLSDHAVMRARQLAALLIAIQPPEGPGDLLWLAQQMADEIVGALVEMAGAV